MRYLLIVPGLLALWINAAFAHTALSKSTPADGEVLASAPTSVQLVYTESVQLLRGELLMIQNDSSEKVDIGFEPSSKAAEQYSVILPPLTHGQYRFEWAVMATDGHPVQGAISFGIGMTPAHEANLESHDHDAN
jgi:copper transport protein